MLVDKNIMKIQVPAGKTISVPAAAAAAAAIDSKTTTTEPSSSTEPPSTEPPSTEPPSKEQQGVSAVVAMNCFEETIDPKDYPALDSKNICLQTDKDITPVLRDIMKLSKKVRSVDLLKVLNYNDTTTSLVEVPCSAKQSGLKKQARRSRWVQRILQYVRKYKEEELVADNEKQEDDDNEEFAYTDDDAARWLITYLGDCYPKEFIKSAQALDMPVHQGKMDAEYTTAMWSDAGVGVAAQRIIMKYFIDFFRYKFTIAEALISQLAVDSVPPVVGTVQYMDRTLDYWYKDLEGLLAGQIAKEHINQPAFTYASVDFVSGAYRLRLLTPIESRPTFRSRFGNDRRFAPPRLPYYILSSSPSLLFAELSI
jgi:hypothetical protein